MSVLKAEAVEQRALAAALRAGAAALAPGGVVVGSTTVDDYLDLLDWACAADYGSRPAAHGSRDIELPATLGGMGGLVTVAATGYGVYSDIYVGEVFGALH